MKPCVTGSRTFLPLIILLDLRSVRWISFYWFWVITFINWCVVVVGPHPFPVMVREFQSVIGRETRQQMLDKAGK